MFNPFDSTGGTYFNLLKRTFQSLKTSAADEQITEIARGACESYIESENIVLARAERERLFNQAFILLLEDMLSNLKKGQKS
jgi:hypothetical protein